LNDAWPKKYRWFATGGSGASGSTITNTTELMKHDDWTSNEFGSCEVEIQLPGGLGLSGQCAVQVSTFV
jgi:hypothetical protein